MAVHQAGLRAQFSIFELQQASEAIAVGNISGYTGKQCHILVVDDRWENRAVLLNLLEPLGFTVAEAENGQVGLDQMRQHPPDLVITDLWMPLMDGFVTLQQLRQGGELRSLKVIVSSASVAHAIEISIQQEVC